jgi:hypothetical protein
LIKQGMVFAYCLPKAVAWYTRKGYAVQSFSKMPSHDVASLDLSYPYIEDFVPVHCEPIPTNGSQIRRLVFSSEKFMHNAGTSSSLGEHCPEEQFVTNS